MIVYEEEIKFNKEDLRKLFSSVNWNSSKYPDKLFKAIENSTYKIFAYNGDRIVGLITGISDGSINLFISYLLVDPSYQKMGIGKTLLNKMIKKGDFNRIQLITEIKNKEFYLKNGFTKDGIGMFKIKW